MHDLTAREREVAQLAAKSNAEIARALNISVNTVKIHMGQVFQKLRVADRKIIVGMAERGEL